MPDMTNGWIACIRRLDGSRFPDGNILLFSAPFSRATLAEQWSEAFPNCELQGITSFDVSANSIINDLVPVIKGPYNNYLNRDDCIDHGLHMTEIDDTEYCDHCGTQDLPGGMCFVFDILDSTGSVVTTIVRETARSMRWTSMQREYAYFPTR